MHFSPRSLPGFGRPEIVKFPLPSRRNWLRLGSQVFVRERLSVADAVAMRFFSLSFPVRQGHGRDSEGARGSLLPPSAFKPHTPIFSARSLPKAPSDFS